MKKKLKVWLMKAEVRLFDHKIFLRQTEDEDVVEIMKRDEMEIKPVSLNELKNDIKTNF